jgi:transcription antitermination factor NusG
LEIITPSRQAWFAIHAKVRWEKHVERALAQKGYEVFLPLYNTPRKWSNRWVTVDVPLFSGYLFCRFDVQRRLPILVTPGVQNILSFGGVPAPVEDREIEAVQYAVRAKASCEPWPYLKAGQAVRLTKGPLQGLEGILIESKKNCKLVVSVSLLQRSVAVQVDASLVEPIRSGWRPEFTEPKIWPSHDSQGL